MYLARGRIWVIVGIICLMYLLSQVPIPYESIGISRTHWFSTIAWFLPSFAGGYYVAKYRDTLHTFRHVKWACLAAFPLLFWLSGQFNYYSDAFSWPAYNATLSGFVAGGYRFLMSFLGIGMAFALADLITRVTWLRRVPQYLGGITLGIYCSHDLFRALHIGEGILGAITMTLIALVLSTAVVWLLGRFRGTDFLFLGGGKGLRWFRQQPIEPLGPVVIEDESRS
jgi:fucose 4-O-acetylase-like acetyltransferase